MQEILELTIDSGGAKSVWSSEEVASRGSKSQKLAKLAAASGSAIRADGDAKLEVVRGARTCDVSWTPPSNDPWRRYVRLSMTQSGVRFDGVAH